ncbi:MAG: hypothetical protein QOG69_361 [Actinomycetota bacterium]|nr:hypothetical protein [Actinomycetota bacterium]
MPREDVPFMAARELLAEETAADATEEERAVHLERAPGEFEDDEQFEEGLVDEEVRVDADSDLEELELDEQFVCEACHETQDVDRLADRDRLICYGCADPYGRRPHPGSTTAT